MQTEAGSRTRGISKMFSLIRAVLLWRPPLYGLQVVFYQYPNLIGHHIEMLLSVFVCCQPCRYLQILLWNGNNWGVSQWFEQPDLCALVTVSVITSKSCLEILEMDGTHSITWKLCNWIGGNMVSRPEPIAAYPKIRLRWRQNNTQNKCIFQNKQTT